MALPWVLLLCVLAVIVGRLTVRRNNRWNEGCFLRAALQEQREMVSADVQALVDRGDAALAKLPAAVATATTAAVTVAINNRDSDRQDDMSAFGGYVGRVEQAVNSVGASASALPGGGGSTIQAGAGDTITGGAGDTLLAGSGDTLVGGSGGNMLVGGETDTLLGGSGSDGPLGGSSDGPLG